MGGKGRNWGIFGQVKGSKPFHDFPVIPWPPLGWGLANLWEAGNQLFVFPLLSLLNHLHLNPWISQLFPSQILLGKKKKKSFSMIPLCDPFGGGAPVRGFKTTTPPQLIPLFSMIFSLFSLTFPSKSSPSLDRKGAKQLQPKGSSSISSAWTFSSSPQLFLAFPLLQFLLISKFLHSLRKNEEYWGGFGTLGEFLMF